MARWVKGITADGNQDVAWFDVEGAGVIRVHGTSTVTVEINNGNPSALTLNAGTFSTQADGVTAVEQIIGAAVDLS